MTWYSKYIHFLLAFWICLRVNCMCRFYCFSSVPDPLRFVTDLDPWIRTVVPLTTGSGSGSCSFRQWPSRCQPKNYFFQCYFTFWQYRNHTRNWNQGFSYFFCMMMEGPGSIYLTNGSGSGRSKNLQIRKTDFHWHYFCRPLLLMTSYTVQI